MTASRARVRAEPLILTSQVPLSQPPEEELERLTKKLVYDMSHPPNGEYFGELSQGGWKGWEAGVRGTVDLASWPMQVDSVPPCPQVGVVAVEKMWLEMELGLWPWTASFMLAALCVLLAGLSFGANISTPWIGGHIVRAAMW